MIVGQLVRETLAISRAMVCEHDWKVHNEREDQCEKCGVIATPEGKAHLARLTQKPPR